MSDPFNPYTNENIREQKKIGGPVMKIPKTCTGGENPRDMCIHWLKYEKMCDGTVKGCGGKR